MKDSVVIAGVIAPYAQALMSLGQDQSLTDRFGEDATLIGELLRSSDELSQLLENPTANSDLKRSVLQQILGEQVHPYMLSFVMLLVDRGRISLLEGICRSYQELLRELNGAVLAEVTSAVELSESQKESIRQKVLEMTGARQVDLSITLDPELLGGVVIKVGSQIVDASLRGQLRRISLNLSSAT